MDDTRWDHALKVTSGGTGPVGHAGAVLLRKAADQAGLTGATTLTCGNPTRTRSAIASGTFPPGSPATPASAS